MKNYKDSERAYNEAFDHLQAAFDHMELRKISLDLFRAMNNLLILVDRKGLILFCNQNWEDTFGYTFSEIYRKPFLSFLAEEDKQRTLEAFSDINNSDSDKALSFAFRNNYLKKDGGKVLIEWEANTPRNSFCIMAIAKVVE